jgi:UDP-glucose-4-epimerase GalE
MENKTALITGGSGYLGSHLSKALKKAGWNVVIFDLRVPMHRYYDNLYIGDIIDADCVSEVLGHYKIDTVFHLAGRIEVGESMKHPTTFWNVNVGGTANLLYNMKYYGIDKIIFSSTAAVYLPDKIPLDEEQIQCSNSVYGNTKRACEQMILDSGIHYGIFRYFNLAGADPAGEMGEMHDPETHLIPNILKNLNTFEIYGNDYNTKDGTCVRDYVHVSDVADAHVKAAMKVGKESFILNLGLGKGYTILDIISIIESELKIKVNYTFAERRLGDPDFLVANVDLAKTKLDFKPKHDITSIVKTAYGWHKKLSENDRIKI